MPTASGLVRLPSACEVLRAAPDALHVHHVVSDVHLEMLEAVRRASGIFLVFGEDDLVTEVPDYNPTSRLPQQQDMPRRLRRALALCDRLVVSTEPLARAYAPWVAGEVVVLPNYLPRALWGGLRSRRRAGPRPRVGWAGAQQHGQDLELLREVLAATCREVDWVFMGMCPESLVPYVRELHGGVPFHDYPRALARLDLDLAVAPLAVNAFNEAKSNLRILEYGALGWPVVCTDIEPYRGAPVERVPNDPVAWIEAIRERVHDLDAAEREGERLRRWVEAGWMLEDHLAEWLRALLPPGHPAVDRRIKALQSENV